MATKLKTEILGDGEEFETPQGWEVFRTAFDRGLWYVVLRKETVETKTPKQSDDPLEL